MATPFDLSGGGGGLMPTAGGDTNWLAQIAQMIGGGVNLGTANSGLNYGRQAAGMADPFSGERGQYMPMVRDYVTNPANATSNATTGTHNALDMLTQFMQHPESLTSMPGYKYGFDQSMEAVNRGAGASGFTNSGNRLTALQDRGNAYAQGWEKQIYDQMLGNVNANVAGGSLDLNAQGQGFNQLALLSGATTGSPGTAGALFANGAATRGQNIGAGIGGLATGIGGLLSNPSFLRMIQGLGGSGGDIVGTGGDWGGGAIDPNSIFGTGGDSGIDFTDVWDLLGGGP